jgi:hypothetical protein
MKSLQNFKKCLILMLTPVMNYPCRETKSRGEKRVTRNGYGREGLEWLGYFAFGLAVA